MVTVMTVIIITDYTIVTVVEDEENSVTVTVIEN